jgi:hypothetical protein
MMRSSAFVLVLAAALSLSACSTERDPAPVDVRADAGADARADAEPDAAVTACEGPCKETRLTAAFGDKSGPLDRAQFGDERDREGVQRFHIEVHMGGDPTCPEETSPTPARTLVLGNVPRAETGEVLTKASGLGATFLDFGAEVTDDFPSPASDLTLTVTAIDAKETPEWFAFDLSATFEGGTITGHAYAEYCASMAE